MGVICTKPEIDEQEALDLSPGRPASRKRPNLLSGGGRRLSLLRVGSRILSRGGSAARTTDRASTYSHVQEAVMYNLREAGVMEGNGDVPSGVVGLRNLGNTCFLNTSLQCLSNTIPLTDYFLGYDYHTEINRDNAMGTGGKLVKAYAELIKQLWLGRKPVVSPAEFKQQLSTFAPQFSGYHQHDTQELLAFLLDGIHEDINRVKKKPYVEDKDCDGTNDEQDAMDAWANYLRRNKSLIVDIFQGQFRNTCTCRVCGHCNIRFEPFMYLSLPISESCQTLMDCLNLYLEQDDLTGENQWYCEKCKTHVDATRKIDLWILPPILIIHLKRFRHDIYGRAASKNSVSLSYPIQRWDLSNHVVSRHGPHLHYDLYAVANHMGGLGGGHYTAHALNRFDDHWYEFNDSSYQRVEPERIQKGSSAYVLFYNRKELDSETNGNFRSLMVRRQSVSRPELWPHAQVRNAEFRSFRREPVVGEEEDRKDLAPHPTDNYDHGAGTANGQNGNGEVLHDSSSPQGLRPNGNGKRKRNAPVDITECGRNLRTCGSLACTNG